MSRWTISINSNGTRQILDRDGSRPYRWYHGIVDYFYAIWCDRWVCRHWRQQQALSRRRGARFYGDGGTIHRGTYLDIEMHEGRIVSVWFRCQPISFKTRQVDKVRAAEMRKMAAEAGAAGARLTGVEVLLTPQEKK